MALGGDHIPMSAPTASNSQTCVLLEAIAPLTSGAVVDDRIAFDAIDERIALDAIDVAPEGRLSFRDLQGPDFGVRLQRSRPGAKYDATTGRLDLILDIGVRPTDAVERFVRRLADSVR
jgi:hypothetical protein